MSGRSLVMYGETDMGASFRQPVLRDVIRTRPDVDISVPDLLPKPIEFAILPTQRGRRLGRERADP
jgi:hypothetical protein